ELAAVAAEVRRVDVDGQVRQRPPEVRERDAAPHTALIPDVDGAVDDDVAGRPSESRDLGVVADLEIEGVGSRSVRSGLEQQCVALRTELVRDLLRGNVVDRRLDLARRHARIEDDHVRTEIWPRSGGGAAASEREPRYR